MLFLYFITNYKKICSGLNQAIDLSQDTLRNLKIIREKNIIGKLFDEIAQDTDKYIYGIDDTLHVITSGALQTLIVWEELEDMYENIPLIEWFIESSKRYGYVVELVSDKTEVGNQFVKGFGGVGGILRYPVVVDTEFHDIDDDDFM